MKKYIYIISCFLLSTTSAFAKDVKTINNAQDMETVILPVDSTALDMAIEKISDSDSAKGLLYSAILEQQRITTGKLVGMCYDMGVEPKETKAFISEYVNILTNRTNCTKANNFTKAEWGGRTYSLQECYNHADTSYRSKETGNITSSGEYKSDSLTGQCKQWVESAEKCQIYLTYYYQDKLLDPDITKKEQKKYKCILDKLETGNVEFPTSKMEESCK